MEQLDLNVPFQIPAQLGDPDIDPAELAHWLAAVPMANVAAAGEQVLAKLHKINRTKLSCSLRHQIISLLQPAADELADAIRGQYMNAPLPLSARKRHHLVTVQQLLAELATGHEIIINDVQEATEREQASVDLLLEGFYGAIGYLARILLESYLIYTPEPKGVWGKLNQLYRYAESQSIHKRTLTGGGKQTDGNRSISHAYRRIALLALANPYHLMQGEARAVYQYLDQWAAACHIIDPGGSQSVAGKFFVDLAADAPPTYQSRGKQLHALEPRILDFSKLVELVSRRITEIGKSDTSGKQAGLITLAARLERDLLNRLRDAWGHREERQSSRETSVGKIHMAAGLSACHHYINDEAPFTPELDEIHFYRQGLGAAESGLSLIPLEHEPWKSEEQAAKLQSGVYRPRTSQFDADSSDKDIWEKIYAAPSSHDDDVDYRTLFSVSEWRKKNESEGGLCLSCEDSFCIPGRVGELVAFKAGDATDTEWTIGAIRWLKMIQDQSLDMGVKMLARAAEAVAIRAIKGAGTGGEYFRALLTHIDDHDDRMATLFTPAAIYDVGTELVVNKTSELFYVRLTKLLTTTKAFSQFHFDVVEMPNLEKERIDSIKALL